jgi:general stress protein YciG
MFGIIVGESDDPAMTTDIGSKGGAASAPMMTARPRGMTFPR